MLKVTDAIHELMGEGGVSGSGSETVKEHVNQVFELMDTNHDGKVTIDEFFNYCNTYQGESMAALP